MTFWCPCITFGWIAEIENQGVGGASFYTFCIIMFIMFDYPCICSCIFRANLRSTYNINGSYWGDICIYSFCEPCTLCQEYRELKNRGFGMELGMFILNIMLVYMRLNLILIYSSFFKSMPIKTTLKGSRNFFNCLCKSNNISLALNYAFAPQIHLS
ncbi:hypothetical protein GIB67_000109 [Kingdonia uniflora]|uniref:Uncharacterized protein n=1 Tax=Kingdonia uniflora TaxID=39325 RepID=A0A7J7M5U2_9MAGN|nr:hypothetical protein GIB67_000109 [Kingdonia uniflora]